MKLAFRLGERGLRPVAFGARLCGERLVPCGGLEASVQVRMQIPRLHELRFDLRALACEHRMAGIRRGDTTLEFIALRDERGAFGGCRSAKFIERPARRGDPLFERGFFSEKSRLQFRCRALGFVEPLPDRREFFRSRGYLAAEPVLRGRQLRGVACHRGPLGCERVLHLGEVTLQGFLFRGER